LGISKDTYYNSKDKQSTLTDKYSSLKPKIAKIIRHNSYYGYPRIKKALLEKYNIVINHKLLLKLLKLWSLELKRKTRKKKKTWITKTLEFLQSRANLLRRAQSKGKLTEPFQAVVSDITEIVYQGGKAYLCVHMDLIGKYVYGWSLSLSPDRHLIINSFNKTKRKLKYFGIKVLTRIIFHQDRGTQYTSADYIIAVLNAGAYLSYSKKGEPGDNAVNEAFFSRLKDE
jgi:putative transposase